MSPKKQEKITRRDFLKEARNIALGGLTMAVTGISSVDSYLEGSEGYNDPANPFSDSIYLYEHRFEPKNLNRLIEMYESLDERANSEPATFKMIEFQRSFSNKLAQFYFEKPFVYMLAREREGITYENIEEWLEESEKYGLGSLILNPLFGFNYNGENFKDALDNIQEDNYVYQDLKAIMFYAHSTLASEFLDDIDTSTSEKMRTMKNISEAVKSYQKIIELDEGFMGKSAISGLANAYTLAENLSNSPLGGESIEYYKDLLMEGSSHEKAEELQKESLKDNENFLTNNILYAVSKLGYSDRESREIFKEERDNVLNFRKKRDVIERWPLWNRFAIFLAKYMKVSGYEESGLEDFMDFNIKSEK